MSHHSGSQDSIEQRRAVNEKCCKVINHYWAMKGFKARARVQLCEVAVYRTIARRLVMQPDGKRRLVQSMEYYKTPLMVNSYEIVSDLTGREPI